MVQRKLRVAFVKFGGLSAGGTERWMQMMAANLPRDEFEIDYYYCDAAPYVGSSYQHAQTDPERLRYIADRVRGRSYRNPASDETLAWLMAQGYQVWRCTESGRLQLATHRQPQQHLAMYLCLHIDKHSAWIEQIHPWAHAFHARKLQDRYFHWREKALKAIHNPSLAARVLAARLRGLMGLS